MDVIIILNRPCNKNISFRYAEANIRRSSEYRKYNTDLPKWLRNKPKYFTKHCIEKINLAKDIKQENVKYVESIGLYFLVKTSTIRKYYKANLGNESTFPRCECDAWKRSLLHCKHMVSVFEYFPEFGWESLPVTYNTLPYFNLDYCVINTKNLVWNDDDEKDDGLYTVIEDEVVIKEIPRKQYSKRTKASNCREILNQIKSLTYLVNDVDTLDALEDQLKVSLELLKNEAPKEDGVIVQPVKVKRIVKQSSINQE